MMLCGLLIKHDTMSKKGTSNEQTSAVKNSVDEANGLEDRLCV